MQATELAGGTGTLVMPAGVSEGGRLEAKFRLSWAGLANIAAIYARLSVIDGSGRIWGYWDGAAGTIGTGNHSPAALPATRTGVILRPPERTLLGGHNNVRMRLIVAPLTAGQALAGTVALQQAALRVV